ncbi:MAG: hypothetical protein WCJ40_09525 [Planctomycetota bacterium]
MNGFLQTRHAAGVFGRLGKMVQPGRSLQLALADYLQASLLVCSRAADLSRLIQPLTAELASVETGSRQAKNNSKSTPRYHRNGRGSW